MRKYAIIDIETTGGLFNRDKIIEVAIIVTDGREILAEYESLVHPERSIPHHITRITGIDDDMVADAPKFYEIAKDIVELTEGCIFVAHNAKFDYGFIKQEFKTLGYPYNKKRLCTVKLTRAHLPGLRSYGLDNLIRHFDLKVENRHRAYGDTFATYEIFSYLYQHKLDEYHIDQIINQGIDATILPDGMDLQEMHDAPETPGVYYLSNVHKRIVYVGKAKNIKTRLFQHFRKLSRKSIKIHNQVCHINYKETGHELIALLLELHAIKTIQPELNKALRRSEYPYALYFNPKAPADRECLFVLKQNKKNDHRYEKVKIFGSKISADGYLQEKIISHEICKRYAKTRNREFACHCLEGCSSFFSDDREPIFEMMEEARNEFEEDFVLILDGREPAEQSFVMIHEGRFWGFGFIERDATITSREEWNDYISYQFSYPEANGIIKTYMRKNKVKKVMI